MQRVQMAGIRGVRTLTPGTASRLSHHRHTVTDPCSSNKDLEQVAPGSLTFLAFVYSRRVTKGKAYKHQGLSPAKT